MTRHRKWTLEEDQELVRIISSRNFNLKAAFKDFHALYPERTYNAISRRWYSTLRLDNNIRTIVTPKKKNCLIMAVNFLKRLLK